MGPPYLKEYQIAAIGALFKAGHPVNFIIEQTKLAKWIRRRPGSDRYVGLMYFGSYLSDPGRRLIHLASFVCPIIKLTE